MRRLIWLCVLLIFLSLSATGQEPPRAPLPLRFSLNQPGYVTLVIEDPSGSRVRNLLAARYFEAGDHVVYWDGLNEGRAQAVTGVQGYRIQREIADPGRYRVRGIVRDAIRLQYEFTIYPNVDQTPWPTDSGRREGGWLGDHGNPTATLFIPAERAPDGRDQMLLANSVNEVAHGLAWVDLDGRKIAGQRHLGGTWTGATHLAYDRGTDTHPDIYAYGRMDWMSDKPGKTQLRLTGLTAAGDRVVARVDIDNSWSGGNPGDLAVHDGLLVYSAFGPDRLVFYDTRAVSVTQPATLLGELPMRAPHALAFDPQGRLLVISDDRLLRFKLGAFPEALTEPEILIGAGLDEPRDLAVDAAGEIYLAEWGASHQVKVFDATGTLQRRIGKPGGPRTGPYDPERMAFPYGLSIDSAGKLWVAARRWWVPKVIYVWHQDGRHLRNHYGPTVYGGGGSFDPADPTRFLYHNGHGGMEFQVDWDTGTAQPRRVYHLSYGAVNDRWDQRVEFFNFHHGPGGGIDRVYRARGHTYISNANWTAASGPACLVLLGDRAPDGAVPLLILGRVGNYKAQLRELGLYDDLPLVQSENPAIRFNADHKTLFLWTDLNRDGVPQAVEFQFHLPDELVGERQASDRLAGAWVGRGTGIVASIELGDDLDIHISSDAGREKPGVVLRLQPERVDADGMPHYDLTRLQRLLEDAHPQRNAATNVLPLKDGRMVVTGGPIQGYRDGKLEWIYHSRWPSLHAGHAGPRYAEHPGQLIATTRVLGPGFTPTAGEGGELWAINSDRGLAYLFTADGLFVDTLFRYKKDGRVWNFPEHNRGMDVSDVNYFDETFFPSITQFADGRVVMVVGLTHSSVVAVKGLDTIRRFQGEDVTVTPADIPRIRQYLREQALAERDDEPDSLTVTRLGKALGEGLQGLLDDAMKPADPEPALQIDGLLTDWPEVDWQVIQRERARAGFGGTDPVDYTTAALGYDDRNLYVAVRSRGLGILVNEGGDLQNLFKSGGGLDIHLATQPADPDRTKPAAGDLRLLVALVDGDPVAVRFRPVAPGAPEPVVYHSAVGETRIDRVEDVSAQIQLAVKRVTLPDGAGTTTFEQVELAVPLVTLGWDPKALRETRGDIGILVGERGRTTERIYWHNKATIIVSDTPTEARLEPAMWGTWTVTP